MPQGVHFLFSPGVRRSEPVPNVGVQSTPAGGEGEGEREWEMEVRSQRGQVMPRGAEDGTRVPCCCGVHCSGRGRGPSIAFFYGAIASPTTSLVPFPPLPFLRLLFLSGPEVGRSGCFVTGSNPPLHTLCGHRLRWIPQAYAFGVCFLSFFWPPFFSTRWTLAVVCGRALWLGWWSFRGNGFVGSSPCEAAVVDSPLRLQLSGNLPHQCHRQALADGLHGVVFCSSMEVGRGSVCDLEEDRLG